MPCGSTPITQSRVIGGQNASPGAWPWQVKIHFIGLVILLFSITLKELKNYSVVLLAFDTLRKLKGKTSNSKVELQMSARGGALSLVLMCKDFTFQ